MPFLQQRWPRGPFNELHEATRVGSAELTIAILAFGSIDIDQGDPQGWTPLIHSSFNNHPSVVGLLLSRGANLSIAGDRGDTALHHAAQGGHVAVTKLLVGAGADLETTTEGFSALQLAAVRGHPQVLTALIEAGANINHRSPSSGATPLYGAAWEGRLDCVKVLLRSKADPFLTRATPSGKFFTPLDAAAERGHAEVAAELIPHTLGKETAMDFEELGVSALRLAGQHRHVNIMAILTDAGVVDTCTGIALCGAAGFGNEASVSFLLEQGRKKKCCFQSQYVNSRDNLGRPPLLLNVINCRPCSPRVARLLLDAGADPISVVRFKDATGSVIFNDTPLELVWRFLSGKNVGGKDASEEQLHALLAIYRLFLQVPAVHAVSWVWPNHVPAVVDAANGTRKVISTTQSPLSRMLPTLRLRAKRPGVLLAPLSRWVVL